MKHKKWRSTWSISSTISTIYILFTLTSMNTNAMEYMLLILLCWDNSNIKIFQQQDLLLQRKHTRVMSSDYIHLNVCSCAEFTFYHEIKVLFLSKGEREFNYLWLQVEKMCSRKFPFSYSSDHLTLSVVCHENEQGHDALNQADTIPINPIPRSCIK